MADENIVQDPSLQSVLDASARTRAQCLNLLELVEQSAVAESDLSPRNVQLELSRQQQLLYAHLSQLRGLNRNAILQTRKTKQTTAEARQEVDRLHLELQNLYYEEKHLRGEIESCKSY
ncbi:MAG: hypothetical protein Q9214_006236, partial [Letrouitia sp. 1 TL-2023]